MWMGCFAFSEDFNLLKEDINFFSSSVERMQKLSYIAHFVWRSLHILQGTLPMLRHITQPLATTTYAQFAHLSSTLVITVEGLFKIM